MPAIAASGHSLGELADDDHIATSPPQRVATSWRADVQVGAGIVADSEPAREYQETVHKAQSMLSALHIANTWRKDE